MIIEIKYKALHWDTHQGGSGKPFDGAMYKNVPDNTQLKDLVNFGGATFIETARHRRWWEAYKLGY